MWLGSITCFQCNTPFVYENVFPEFDLAQTCSMEALYIEELSDETKHEIKDCIIEGHKAVSMKFNMFLGIRMPTRDEFRTKSTTLACSMKKRGDRFDEFWRRSCQREFGSGFTPHRTVEERLVHDR